MASAIVFHVHSLSSVDHPYVHNASQDANKLVEEFMLLTNITVAKIISSVLPDRALLR
jgi:DIS3-like exonuclease 2